MGRLSDEWKYDEIKPRPAKDREKAAKRIVSLPYEEAVKEMEKLHSEFNIGDYNDIGMRIMEKTKGNPDNYGVKVPVTEDIKELKEKHKEKGTANKDDKDLLGLANKLLGGNSQMLLKYNNLPYFDVLKDEDKATYRVYTDGSDKFEKIKDDVKDSPFKDPNYEVNKALSEIDTNDNDKIEVDEMADFQKSLDDYASKNKKDREDIPVRYRK